jgi:hypothetical protein
LIGSSILPASRNIFQRRVALLVRLIRQITPPHQAFVQVEHLVLRDKPAVALMSD